jgi:hypothetical protein
MGAVLWRVVGGAIIGNKWTNKPDKLMKSSRAEVDV